MLVFVLLAFLQAAAPLQTIAKGPMSGVDVARHVVLRTPAELTMLWQTHAPGRALPSVDFAKQMVVGVFLGTRPTGGYGVEIVRATMMGGGLRVEFVETAPRPDAITAQVLTAPYHLVAVPRTDGDVQFQKADR